MRKTFVWIKQNIFSVVCVLMAVAVFLTGGISYSKYISSDPLSEKTNVGNFTCVATIDGVSALSFTNTAFWGGSVEDDRIAMNALRTLEFTVSNHETVDGVKKVNNVKTGYTLAFSAPQNFGDKLALQLFDESANAIMPQIVIEDILSTKDGNTYNTANSEDYHADVFEDMHFTVNKSGQEGSETVTAKCNDKGITVTIEPFEREVKQTLLFRLWDCSSLTDKENPTANTEGGTLCPPLEITYTSTVPYYRIMISHPSFTMDAGTEETHTYSIRIAPTSTIFDPYLGGTMGLGTDGKLQVDGEGSSHTISAHYETVTDEYADGTVKVSGGSVLGSYTVYNEGETVTTTPTAITTVTESSDTKTTNETKTATTFSPTNNELEGNYDPKDKVEQADSSRWTTYYKHTQDVSQTRTTTTTQIEKTTETFTSTTEQTETAYTILTNSVSTDGETITQTVTEEKTVSTHSDVTAITTTKTTTTVTTEVYSGTRTYYTYTTWGDDSNHTYVDNDDTYPDTIDWSKTPDSSQTSDPQESTTTETNTSVVTAEPIKTTAEFFRTLTRYTRTAEIKIDGITYTLNDVKYVLDTEGDEFSLFETVQYEDGSSGTEQKYYLSQCYSKNYPLTVNVIFEQLQS